MSQGWENHEPAPLEFFHAEMMKAFHRWRITKVVNNEINVLINGGELNDMIAAVKKAIYEKYPKQITRDAVLKSDM